MIWDAGTHRHRGIHLLSVQEYHQQRCARTLLYYEEKRYEGGWHTQEKILFPGYVFMITDKYQFKIMILFLTMFIVMNDHDKPLHFQKSVVKRDK